MRRVIWVFLVLFIWAGAAAVQELPPELERLATAAL